MRLSINNIMASQTILSASNNEVNHNSFQHDYLPQTIDIVVTNLCHIWSDGAERF